MTGGGFLCSGQDQSLRTDEKKYRIFFENSADAMLIIEDGIFVDCNVATVEMLGYEKKEEIINSPPFKLSPECQPDGRSSIEKAEEMMQLARERGSHKFEWNHLKKDGSIIPVEVSLTAIHSIQGDSIHTVWRDISRRKVAEKAIRDSEHRFHTIFETIPDVVAITRMSDNVVIDINQAYESLTGFKRDQLIGRSSIEFGSWVNFEDRERMIEQIRQDGFVRNLEVSMRTSDNTVREALVSAKMINLHGEHHLLTVFKDISDRARSQAALRESEERFRQIFETIPDPVVLASLEDGGFIDVNKAFVEITGISRIQAIGHNSADLGLWVNEDKREPFLAELQKYGEVNNLEADFRVSGGKIKAGLISARIINVNREHCILVVIRDISKEKEAERALIEMDRMKSDFISTAAHELRTPITSIMGYSDLLIDNEGEYSFTEDQRKDFKKEISENSERLSKIIDDILDLSRIESGQSIPLDIQSCSIQLVLNKVIKRILVISEQKIILKVSKNTPEKVKFDPHRIVQVVENLLGNAIKYSPPQSEIKIFVEKENNHCRFSFVDQGIGMTDEQVTRVFDKFYRADGTDTAVRGLGIGMSIVKQIIESHGGSIWVESSVGKGTKVTFVLPIN